MNNFQSRTEHYLAYLAGNSESYPVNPQSRVEQYLLYLCENGGGRNAIHFAKLHTVYRNNDWFIVDEDDAVQTFESIKTLYQDSTKFVYCVHTNVVLIPAFLETRGFEFTGTYYLNEQANLVRLIINNQNDIHMADVPLETTDHRVDDLTDWESGEGTEIYYPSAEATLNYVDPKIGEMKNVLAKQAYDIDNLKAAAEGQLYRVYTDDSEAYEKYLPNGVLNKVLLDSMRGSTAEVDGQTQAARVSSLVLHGKNLQPPDDPEKPDANYSSSGSGQRAVQYSEELGGYYTTTHRAWKTVLEPGIYTVSLKAKKDPNDSNTNWNYVIRDVNNGLAIVLLKSNLTDEFQTVSYTFEVVNEKEGATSSFEPGTMKLFLYSGIVWKDIQIERGDKFTGYVRKHDPVRLPIPEGLRAMPGYGGEGSMVDFEGNSYRAPNGEIFDLTGIVPLDFAQLTVENNGSIEFEQEGGMQIPVKSTLSCLVRTSGGVQNE